jgi:lycopene beta-cyclase
MQVILGAGLSGLSLAVAMVRHGVRDEIVVVDRRTEFGRDRTWCTWADPATPFLELADHRWDAWEVTAGGRPARHQTRSRPYVHIRSDRFYEAALEELERAPNVTLRLGTQVTEIGDGWARTSAGLLEGHVHDGLAMGSPALARVEMGLWQTFRGWEVRTERPRFEPGVATLMDFDVEQEPNGVQFLYVLPFEPDRALVEHTSLARGGMSPHKRQRAVREFLGGEHEVLRQERGRLPMTTLRLPARRGERTTAIGVAGGALRSATGYAFTRVQTHSAAIARAVAAGEPPPRRAGPPQGHALDVTLIHALTQQPEAFPGLFRTLVERVPADAFARFMTDRATPRDLAQVARALPPGATARAAAQALLAFRRPLSAPGA